MENNKYKKWNVPKCKGNKILYVLFIVVQVQEKEFTTIFLGFGSWMLPKQGFWRLVQKDWTPKRMWRRRGMKSERKRGEGVTCWGAFILAAGLKVSIRAGAVSGRRGIWATRRRPSGAAGCGVWFGWATFLTRCWLTECVCWQSVWLIGRPREALPGACYKVSLIGRARSTATGARRQIKFKPH